MASQSGIALFLFHGKSSVRSMRFPSTARDYHYVARLGQSYSTGNGFGTVGHNFHAGAAFAVADSNFLLGKLSGNNGYVGQPTDYVGDGHLLRVRGMARISDNANDPASA
jgi:hypothetical protein